MIQFEVGKTYETIHTDTSIIICARSKHFVTFKVIRPGAPDRTLRKKISVCLLTNKESWEYIRTNGLCHVWCNAQDLADSQPEASQHEKPQTCSNPDTTNITPADDNSSNTQTVQEDTQNAQTETTKFIVGKIYSYSFFCNSGEHYCKIIDITDKTALIRLYNHNENQRVKLRYDKNGAYFYVCKGTTSIRPSDIVPKDIAINLHSGFEFEPSDTVQYNEALPETPEHVQPEPREINYSDFLDDEQLKIGYFSVGQSFDFCGYIYTVKSRSKSFIILKADYGKEYRKKVYNTNIKSFRGIPGNLVVRVPEFVTFNHNGYWAHLSSKHHLIIDESAQPETADNPGFTVVPSEHIERPEYTVYPDTITDDCPYTVIPACDIPAHNPAAAVVPYADARNIRNFFHILAIYIRMWLAINIHKLNIAIPLPGVFPPDYVIAKSTTAKKRPALIPQKQERKEAWQSHSCQYCENDPRPEWTHKQFALGIILSTEYSNYKTKTRYCTKSMSEWFGVCQVNCVLDFSYATLGNLSAYLT